MSQEETLIELLERRFVTADRVIRWDEQVKSLIQNTIKISLPERRHSITHPNEQPSAIAAWNLCIIETEKLNKHRIPVTVDDSKLPLIGFDADQKEEVYAARKLWNNDKKLEGLRSIRHLFPMFDLKNMKDWCDLHFPYPTTKDTQTSNL